MRLSVFTPHYRGTNPYIGALYETLKAQTYTDWEWIIVLNNGGELPAEVRADARIWPVRYPGEGDSIGALKRYACEQCQGNVLVEVDADDLLTPDCLAEIAAAFEDEAVTFAYSNSAGFEDGTWEPKTYSSAFGWVGRDFEWQGHKLIEMRSFAATPQAMRAIYWCPNHVRAWRASAYREIGGHNPEMAVIDDYDLLCRTYLHGGEMRHIDRCLYLYRYHEGQTTKAKNPPIQAQNGRIYEKYILPMAEAWARREGLALIDLGAAHGKPEGYTGLDLHDADIECDLCQGIPLPDNSVGIVRAYDFLEHMADPVAMMNEIYRVLTPGGWLFAETPSTDGRGAFQDPTHKSFWNENSFWYYTRPQQQQYVPEITARFQESRVVTWFPSEWHKEHNIPYVSAQLIALKPGYWRTGECPGRNEWRDNG